MEPRDFHALIERLRDHAAAEPRKYRMEVGLLALVGYGYIAAVFVLVLGMIVLLAYGLVMAHLAGVLFKLLIPLVVVLGAILRALWVRLPAPQGMRIRRSDAPELFGLIRRTTRRLSTPRFHVVQLTDDFNAGVVQVPRLGILGWHRNYLRLGLPLLDALSPEEFHAVLAHEFGHLSRKHARFAAWIYRVRLTWHRLLEQFERRKSSLGAAIFGWFTKHYAPYFNAYSFVLARNDEYEADRCAAELTSPRTVAVSLLRIEIVNRALQEKFWSDVSRQVVSTEEPPPDVYDRLRGFVADPLPSADRRRWLDGALRRPTDDADTHPATAERLAALGVDRDSIEPEVYARRDQSAADAYLGRWRETAAASLSERWRQTVGPDWKEQRAATLRARERLGVLAAAAQPLSLEEQWEQASLVLDLDGQAAARPLLERLLERAPDHAGARFQLGQAKLDAGDDGGVADIEAVMAADPDALLPGYGVLFGYFWSRGIVDRAEHYRTLATERQEQLTSAAAERSRIEQTIALEPHDLPAAHAAALAEDLRRVPDAAEVYLARRRVVHLPEVPCYLVGIVPAWPWYRSVKPEQVIRLRDAVLAAAKWPRETYAIVLVSRQRWLRDRMRRIPGARVSAASP